MKRDIVRPETAKQLEDCWQANNEEEALRLVKWLADTFKVKAKAVTLSECKDLER